jgi:hypothetical protein
MHTKPKMENTRLSTNYQYAVPDPLRSVYFLLQEIPPARLLVVKTPYVALPLVGALGVHHPQCCICKVTGGDDMLLKQLNDKDELYELSRNGPEGLREKKDAMTYHVMIVSMLPIRRLLQLLILTTLLPPKDPAVALIVSTYRLY